jgi:hypothetical protein
MGEMLGGRCADAVPIERHAVSLDRRRVVAPQWWLAKGFARCRENAQPTIAPVGVAAMRTFSVRCT